MNFAQAVKGHKAKIKISIWLLQGVTDEGDDLSTASILATIGMMWYVTMAMISSCTLLLQDWQNSSGFTVWSGACVKLFSKVGQAKCVH
jgi:hypothetical protein